MAALEGVLGYAYAASSEAESVLFSQPIEDLVVAWGAGEEGLAVVAVWVEPKPFADAVRGEIAPHTLEDGVERESAVVYGSEVLVDSLSHR